MKKSLFFTLNISKYQNFLIKILVLAFIFLSNRFISQIYISDSSIITISADVCISNNTSIPEKVQIYITKGTRIKNIDAFSDSELIYTGQNNKNEVLALVQKNNPKKINKKHLLPKEKVEVEFKINEKEKVSFTINSIVKNNFTTPVQPKKIHFKSYSFDKVSYIFFHYSQKNIGFVKKGKSIEITSVFKVRPPPFIQNI